MDLLAMIAAIGWKVLPRINIGPLSISPHGIGIAVGFALGGVLLARRAKRFYGIDPDHVWNMLMWAVVGVIVGSRLFYVAGHLADYLDDPVKILRVWEGGVVFYGGAIGGVVAALPYMRKHGLPGAKLFDAAAPGFPLGLIFGRIGDLIIGDHFGQPTTFVLGFRYQGCIGAGCEANVPPVVTTSGALPRMPAIGEVLHQTALYDLISVTLLFAVVMLLGRKPRPNGWLMLFVVTWYAAARFVTDFARTTNEYLGLHGTQWVSLALVLFGIVMLVRMGRTSPDDAEDDQSDEADELLAEGSDVERP